MSDPELDRRDARLRPADPAGTRPKVDPASLEPATSEPLLLVPASHGDVIDATAEEEPLAPGDAIPDLLPAPRPAAGVGAPRGDVPTPHAPRFQFVLGMLIAFGVAAIALTAGLLVDHRQQVAPSLWSAWHPHAGPNPAQQIANHVGAEYRLPSGHELVAVTGGPLEVAGLPVTVALRSDPSNNGNISLVSGTGVLYRLCGLGPKCAIDEGKASVARHLLLQREALELALYTFHYVDNVNQVVVFLPPRPGADPSQALFFRPSDLDQALARPLDDTLTPTTPTTTNFTRSADAPLVVRLTEPTLYTFSLTQANQDASVFLVLSPFGVAATGATTGSATGSATGTGSGSSSSGSSTGSGTGSATSGSGSPTSTTPSSGG